MTDTLHDLENLIKSPGWQMFKQAQETYWREQLVPHVRNAANQGDDSVAIQKIRQIAAAESAIRMALEWPEAEIRKLKADEANSFVNGPSMRRGGR